MKEEKELNIDEVIAHVKEWNSRRHDDIQAIMSNPAGEWEKGIMLSNAHGQDIQQLLKYVHYLALIIKANQSSKLPDKEG